MPTKIVTILVPTHNTPELTILCLRLLRKYTDPDLARVIVIDNKSTCAALDYLRSLQWIELIERDTTRDSNPSESHARALDTGFSRVRSPFALSIHTDTLIRRHDWLNYLLSKINQDSNIAAVGSWKMHEKPMLIQWADTRLKGIFPVLKGHRQRLREQRNETGRYLRSHCALYRTELIRRYELSFVDHGISSTGRLLHQGLVERGHAVQFLPPRELAVYLDHLNHATHILNTDLETRTFRPRRMRRGLRRIQREFDRFDADKVLKDTSLDK